MNHPIQPLIEDASGTVRFNANGIVRYLLDMTQKHGFGLNEIAALDVPQEDHEQFAQLIGYSLTGFSTLSYVSDDTYAAAETMVNGETEDQARIKSLEQTLEAVREHLRNASVAAFRIHPDDLRA